MDATALIALLVSLVFTVVVMAVTLVGSLVLTVAPILIAFVILRRVGSQGFVLVGPSVQVSGLAVNALASAAKPTATDDPSFVKRTACSSCGSPKVQRSLSAYVYCDFCGELYDWDFRAAMADKRSKAPGPMYEALLRESQAPLARARAAGDRAAYEATQRKIWSAYAKHCPAALSPRIGDERYREAWVAFSAANQTAQDLDDTCAASFAEQSRLTAALQWDRSNPFQPKARPETFWPLLGAVLAHQRNAAHLSEREGLLAKHPDRPSADLMIRMGVSAMAQGWIPFLPPSEVDRLLTETGLKDEYHRVEPPKLESGPCPSCAAPLEVPAGAKRVVCHHCGHLAGVHSGTLKCHGCAGQVTIPEGSSLFACPFCSAELRMMRW